MFELKNYSNNSKIYVVLWFFKKKNKIFVLRKKNLTKLYMNSFLYQYKIFNLK